MAYFPNGSSGMELEFNYCSNCIHTLNCTILTAHYLYNYDQCDDPGMKKVLDAILPERNKCEMFVEGDAWCPAHLQ